MTPPLSELLEGKHLIVTGATGFVGKVWLSMLLTHMPQVRRITLLTRPGRFPHAAERVAKAFDISPALRPVKAAHGRDWQKLLQRKLFVVDADISLPDLGMPADVREELVADADAVVHFAGLTDFQPDPLKGLASNTFGALHMASLASELKTPRMIHVSTCFVAGRRDGRIHEGLVPGLSPNGTPFDALATAERLWEEIATIGGAHERIDHVQAAAEHLGWPNIYTFTKGLAEHVLAAQPVKVHTVRPAVVECARTFPFPGWNEGLNTAGPIMWYIATGFRDLPVVPGHRFDVVPVDTVVRTCFGALAQSLQDAPEAVYQVATSDLNPTTFAQTAELTSLAARRHAQRHGTTLGERLRAHTDIRAIGADAPGVFSPSGMSGLMDGAQELLGKVKVPSLLGRKLKGEAESRLRRTRRKLRNDARRIRQLDRMFETYTPFIQDHDWIFEAHHTQALLDDVHDSERDFLHDDLRALDWRTYWLDVQFPGSHRWTFPVMDRQTVPTDPPSTPALTLPGPSTHSIQGAA